MQVGLAILVLAVAVPAAAATYYVDADRGDDARPGTVPDAAWRTLEKVNATTFQPGDRLLFRAGAAWTGQLWPKGSGAEGRPIVIGRYGDGPKPAIRGAGAMAAVYLENQEYWEIADLAVTNEAATPGYRRGVLIRGQDLGRALRHLHLRALDVQHVTGKLGADIPEKTTGGIGVEAVGTARATRFDDVVIEDCRISSVDSTGIYTWSEAAPHPRDVRWEDTRNTGVRIRRNHLVDIGKNAIVVRGSLAPVIESNVIERAAARLHGNAIYVFGCKDAVMQFNEVSGTRFDGLEGAAFDSDYNSEGTLIQYNYSHDNGGGLVNLCNNPASKPPRGYNDGTIVRYNISQNEVERVIAFDGPVTNTLVYNNTIYVGPSLSPRIVEFDTFGKAPGYAARARFFNNLVVNAGAGTYAWGESRDVTFDHNCFSGTHPPTEPADEAKVVDDPLLVLPGSGGIGLDSLLGYRLRPGSPCADSGAAAENHGGRDFWGSPLYAGAPDRGAHERSAPGAPAATAARFERVDVTRDVPFASVRDVDGAEVRLTLDVYEPAGDTASNRPAIVWIHGGGFRPGTDKRQGYIVTLATAFAQRGYVSIAPDYRVRSTPDRDRPATIRDAVADTRAALGWLREKSTGLRVSPDRITVAGGSAGGRTAVGLAMAETGAAARPAEAPPCGAVVLWGSPDASWGLAVPTSRFPPTLLIHGTKDVTVPYEHSERLAAVLRGQGVDTVLLPLPGAAHTPTEHIDLIVETLARFLERVCGHATSG